MNPIFLLPIAIVVGLIAGFISHQTLNNFLGLGSNMSVGVAGAFIGYRVLTLFKLSLSGVIALIMYTLLGAATVLFVVSQFTKKH